MKGGVALARALALGGLAATLLVLAPKAVPANSEAKVTFWVYLEDAEGHLVGYPRLEVILLGEKREIVGKTGGHGEISVPKSLLQIHTYLGAGLLPERPAELRGPAPRSVRHQLR